ncbi:MAG: DivIVA domain-containing protein [Solirubrobacterales bacterium]|nr:DivIVA domain-containing protein [Solirubrobacterales bacterium]
MASESFRRALRGYDPEEVDAALSKKQARVERLEREAKQLAQRVMEKERRLQEALARLGEEGEDSPGAIASLSRRLEEIHGQARQQATRIRMKALDDAVQMADRVSELARLRDDLGSRVFDLAGRAGIGPGHEADQAAAEEAPATPPAPRGGIYEGAVEVEVGPLNDFSQLAGFEDAAAKVDGADEIKVRRFSGRRATVSISLSEPVELLRQLEEHAPFEFKISDQRSGRVVLDIDDDEHHKAA